MATAPEPLAQLEMLESLVGAAPVGLVFADANGDFRFANAAAQALFGGLSGTTRGPERGTYALLRPDGSLLAPAELPMVRASERGETVDNFDMRVRRRDGSERHVLVSARPVHTTIDGEARIAGSVAMLVDVTARQNAELERARAKDEFLAMVSHELRTPLNAILGWAHMLDQNVLDPETVRKAVQTILRNANMQARLVHDLIEMSRILSGQMRLDVRELELIPVIEAAIETLVPAATAKRIELVRDLDPKAEPILGDATRMQQVVWNLVSNAIKFTPAGGRVEVRLERAGANVRIVVSDTGEGIRPAFLPYVFDRFRRSAASDPRPAGLGLGLAIVRHVVELHGGVVEARSEGEGRGATLLVTLPWWNPREIEAAADSGEEVSGAPVDLDGLRVLFVEDDPDTRELVTFMLSRFGASVRAVPTAGDALTELVAFRPDVLVSDINMPSVDGYELIRAVRQLPPEDGGRIPAIALTAFVRNEDRRNALAAGYDVHVPKPVTPAKLTAVLGFVLRQRRPGPDLG